MSDQNDVKLIYEAFFAIAESFTSIVYMDTADEKVYKIRLDDYSVRYEEALNAHPKMQDILRQYVTETVYKDDADGVMKLADREYVKEQLAISAPLLHIYRTIHNNTIVYYRIKIVPIEDGKKIVYGFENIDDQFRQQLEIKAEKEKQMIFLDGLSREYMSVWFLDGKSRKVTLIKNNGSDSENGEPVRIGNTMVDYHFSMQKYFGSFARPEDFDRLMNETGYDVLVEKAGENDLYNVNYIRINPDKSTSLFQVSYAKTIDSSQIASFVFGFRKIDSYV